MWVGLHKIFKLLIIFTPPPVQKLYATRPMASSSNPNLYEPELKTSGTNCKQPQLGGSPTTQH